jgi:hypothetical protein
MGYWGAGAMENDGALDIEGDLAGHPPEMGLDFLMHLIRRDAENLSKSYGDKIPAIRAAGHLLKSHFPEEFNLISEAAYVLKQEILFLEQNPGMDFSQPEYVEAAKQDLAYWSGGEEPVQIGLMEKIMGTF